jgi:hypothetical protein
LQRRNFVLAASQAREREGEFGNLRGRLIEIAIAEPGGTDDEMDKARPMEASGTVCPGLEINFLVVG